MEVCFEWVEEAKGQPPHVGTRGCSPSDELLRVLDDTRVERSLRRIVVERKNRMFYGSDVHGDLPLTDSRLLHRIEPTQYPDDMPRVVPYSPKKRQWRSAPLFSGRARKACLPREGSELTWGGPKRTGAAPPELALGAALKR